jgi:hypothetical protein
MNPTVCSKTAALVAAAVIVPIAAYAVGFTALTGANWDSVLRDGESAAPSSWVDFFNNGVYVVDYSDNGWYLTNQSNFSDTIDYYSNSSTTWSP